MKIGLSMANYAHPPSPVVLVSTINKKGRKNVAPFGFFMCCSHKPPMMAVGIRKIIHTYKYAKEVREFVIGIPTPKIVEKVFQAGEHGGSDDEFAEAGLTPIQSKVVKPFRIKECQVNFECKLVKELYVGDHTLIIGEVVEADCDPKIFSEDKVKLRTSMDSLYHITGPNFTAKDGKIIKIK